MAALIIKEKIYVKNIKKIQKFVEGIKNLSDRKNSNLRNEKVGKITSQIAVLPFIRKFINKQQHFIVSRVSKNYRGCVIDGRDIGTKVFKKAKIKLYIEVNIKIRAKRRHKQLIEQGEKSIYSRILKDLKLRDKTDTKRNVSPLVVPKKAIIVDNSYSFKNTIEQLEKAMFKIKKN